MGTEFGSVEMSIGKLLSKKFTLQAEKKTVVGFEVHDQLNAF